MNNFFYILDKNGANVYVFLKRCSNLDQIKFDCKVQYSIVNSQFNATSKIPKGKWKEFYETNKSDALGPKMMNSVELKERRGEICHDGKLRLRAKMIAINLNAPEDDLNSSSDEASLIKKLNLIVDFIENDSMSDPIFDILTSVLSAGDGDVLIKTDDGMVLKAHKSILSKKSSVFQNMFSIDMEEAATKSVDIIDFKGPVMQELLRFIYFGKVNNIDQVNIELFKAAKVYDIAVLDDCVSSRSSTLE